MHFTLDLNIHFPEPLYVVVEEYKPVARIAFCELRSPIMPTPITSLSVVAGATSDVIELDKFAADGSDLGADTDGPSFASSDAAIATVNDHGGGQLSVTGVAAGSATITGTDAGGHTAVLSVTVEAPPPPPVDHVSFVSLP